jgi:hypothetical protein
MADLGDFGAAVEEATGDWERNRFRFFGRQFEVVGDMPPMLHFQIAAAMTGKLDESEGAVAMWEALTSSLDEPDLPKWEGDGPDERPRPKKQFGEFYRIAVDRHATLESLMELTMTLFQVGSGRPTVQVSDSSAGPSSTSPSSNTSSTHPKLAHLTPVSEVLAG